MSRPRLDRFRSRSCGSASGSRSPSIPRRSTRHPDPCTPGSLRYVPRLVAGFRGRIFCTPATRELCSLVLPDSARIQEEDARDANRHGYTRHAPALPLYTENDAARALMLLQPVGYERPVPVVPGLEVDFVNA